MAVDAVQDVVDLLVDNINYANIENTSATLHIVPIYNNERLDYVNVDNIQIYEIDTNDNDDDYFNRGKYHQYTKLSIQIITRQRNSGTAGLLPIRDEVRRVLETFRNWKVVDNTANFDHMYISRTKDLSDKRNNFSKLVMDIELQCIAVARSN